MIHKLSEIWTKFPKYCRKYGGWWVRILNGEVVGIVTRNPSLTYLNPENFWLNGVELIVAFCDFMYCVFHAFWQWLYVPEMHISHHQMNLSCLLVKLTTFPKDSASPLIKLDINWTLMNQNYSNVKTNFGFRLSALKNGK